jgi:GT2 family glycosyltransferase
MSARPALSIVIPSHGTRLLTLACLTSIAGASVGGVEVIVVDDASPDGTPEAVASAFPEARLVRHPQALGFTAAANRGLALARGDVLLLLNSDTEVSREGLTALLHHFAAEPRLGVAGAALRYPDGSPQWSGGPAPSLPWFAALSSGLPPFLARWPLYRRLRPVSAAAGSREVAWVTGAALAARRAAWETVGPLDEGFRFYAQDLDFCLRASAAGWDVQVLADFGVLHHHGASIGRAAGTLGRQQTELLWTDLLRWAEKHRGPGWAARAAAALRLGGRLRLAARRLSTPFHHGTRRAALRAETAVLERALVAVARARRAILPDSRG